MVKYHLKRLNAPSTWDINRKENTFITRPLPSGHKMENSLPVSIILKDILKVGKTTREIKHIITHNNVIVNGRRIKDIKASVGFMDVLEIKETNGCYRMILGKNKKLNLIEIGGNDKNLILMKVIKKTLLKKKKMQLNFSNGYNILGEKKDIGDVKMGDVVVYDFNSRKIVDMFRMEKGSTLFLTGGKHTGEIVKLEGIKDDSIIFKTKDNEVYETSLEYGFLVGRDIPSIKVE